MALERIQKILSAAGVCSRREAEEYIIEGKVKGDVDYHVTVADLEPVRLGNFVVVLTKGLPGVITRTFLAGFTMDITERKSLEQAMIAAAEKNPELAKFIRASIFGTRRHWF